jgi:DNA-binding CsgD family transcriptional regulator
VSRLLGRAQECAALDAAVARARGREGGSLLVTGGPGAGKSALLDYVVRSAGDAETIRIEGLEPEAEIGLAGLHRLLLFHTGRRPVLPPAQRRALDASLGLAGRAEAAPFLLGLAVLTVLNDLSRSRPLVCLIDDAHWLDPESAQVLAFVARRLRNERILMLFAARDQPEAGAFGGIPELAVQALGLDDAVQLLLGAAGDIALDRRVARDIAARAEGNPLAVIEVGRELAARNTTPSALLDEPLPVGQRLRRHYEAQIRRVPAETRQLLLLAAANMGPAAGTLWRATELAGLSPDAAGPAERGGLIDLSPDLRFRHPLIRAAAYGSASAPARRRAHDVLAAAARTLDDQQAAAWHLAAAALAPAEGVAAELEAAAAAARGRGSLLNESAFLARAAELSPSGPDATRRRLRAAEAALLGGAPLRAESLTRLIPASAPGRARAQAEHLRVQARLATGRSVADAPAALLGAGLSCLDDDPGLARGILLEAAAATIAASQLTAGISPPELGGRILGALGDHAPHTGEEHLLAGLATLLTGRYLAAAPLLRKAIGILAAGPGPVERVPVWLMAVTFAATAIWEDEFALAWVARCEDLARRTGAMRPLTLCLIGASIANGARGQLALAEQQLAEGRELGQALGWDAGQLGSFAGVRNIAFRGDRQAVRRALEDQRAIAARRGTGDMLRVALAAQTILHLGLGEYADAFEAATAMRRDDTVGMSAEALPAVVEAGLRSGHRAEAAAALADLERCATASGTGWALGLLARSRALTAPPDEACALYREAIDILGRTCATADLARAHLLFGEWLRRHQRTADARDHLHTAHGLFTAIGAASFARRARAELQAAGAGQVAPQPREPALTARESQIAALAAAGYANQEIADRLFITTHTVEYHLKKVFRKLGVVSRRQLRDKVGDELGLAAAAGCSGAAPGRISGAVPTMRGGLMTQGKPRRQDDDLASPAGEIRLVTPLAEDGAEDGAEGGDPVCWAHLVCDECGAITTEGHRAGCSRRPA